MSRPLPECPNLEHLKKQAKDLLHGLEDGSLQAAERYRSLLSRSAPTPPKLADVQHAIAREYGFESWAKLKQHVEDQARQSDGVAELVAAIQSDDPKRAARALADHPELKQRLDDPLPGLHFGATPLLAALPWANREMIDLLLAAGANINQRSHWWAGGFGVLDDDRGLVPYLIERGARIDVNAAAKLGMMDDLERLIAADPKLVSARGGDGQTPLHVARTVEVARWLLERGAEIDALDVDHESTPAQYAVRERQDVARFLVSRGCRTDLLMAAALGDHALAERHLDQDPGCIRMSVSPEWFPMRDKHAGGSIYIWTLGMHKTAHLVAREFGHEDVLRLLLDRSPESLKLALACELGDEDLFRRMLAERPDLSRTLTDDDQRKLVRAAQNDNANAVRLMLEAGWPPDVRGGQNGTPLHWAAWHGNVAMVHELLRHGAPLEIRGDDYDMPPIGWALHGSLNGWHKDRGDYAGVIEALLDAGAKAPSLTAKLECSDAVREVLRRRSRG